MSPDEKEGEDFIGFRLFCGAVSFCVRMEYTIFVAVAKMFLLSLNKDFLIPFFPALTFIFMLLSLGANENVTSLHFLHSLALYLLLQVCLRFTTAALFFQASDLVL